MKKISLQEIYDKYLEKVKFPDTCKIFFYEDKEKGWNEIRDDILIDACNKIKEENLTKHNSRTIQSATDYIHRYETKYPAVSGTKELIHFIEWLLKEVAD